MRKLIMCGHDNLIFIFSRFLNDAIVMHYLTLFMKHCKELEFEAGSNQFFLIFLRNII